MPYCSTGLAGPWLPHIGQTYVALDVSRIDTLVCYIEDVLGSRVWVVNLTLLRQGGILVADTSRFMVAATKYL